MTKNKTNNTITTTAHTPAYAHSSQVMVNQQHSLPVSALSQQLEQVSLDKGPQHRYSSSSSSPKRRPSSKRKPKSDFGTGSGNDLPQPPAKPKRSPKSNKVNAVKQFSTPSKTTSTPNGDPYGPATQDLATHYAGPTFHSSPAPSSLPMPSFFTSSKGKSVVPDDGEQDSPPNQFTPVKPLRSINGQAFRDQDDSPLAPFFKADREEKNRLRNKHSADKGVFGSPTQRPASVGGVPDYLNLRSGSPLFWNDSPQKANGRFDLRSKKFYYQC